MHSDGAQRLADIQRLLRSALSREGSREAACASPGAAAAAAFGATSGFGPGSPSGGATVNSPGSSAGASDSGFWPRGAAAAGGFPTAAGSGAATGATEAAGDLTLALGRCQRLCGQLSLSRGTLLEAVDHFKSAQVSSRLQVNTSLQRATTMILMAQVNSSLQGNALQRAATIPAVLTR